jgi:hypothetical protein
MAANSLFPATSMNEFTSFVRKAKFIDKNLKQYQIDNHFVMVNFEEVDQGDNPNKALIRFEFIEMLVRMAKDKYFRPGIASSVTEAFEMVIEKNLMPITVAHEWHGWREKELWTVECNDVIQANLDGLKKVYNYYTS